MKMSTRVLNDRARIGDSGGLRVALPRLRVGLPAAKRAHWGTRRVSEGTCRRITHGYLAVACVGTPMPGAKADASTLSARESIGKSESWDKSQQSKFRTPHFTKLRATWFRADRRRADSR